MRDKGTAQKGEHSQQRPYCMKEELLLGKEQTDTAAEYLRRATHIGSETCMPFTNRQTAVRPEIRPAKMLDRHV